LESSGTPYLCHVLSRYGYTDVAYKLLNQEDYPSWLYPIKQGATTIWERWDGIKPDGSFQDAGMNSFNHYAYGAIGAWMYTVIGGIDLDPDQPGYKHIIMRPQLGGGLTYAKARLHSLYGLIQSEWTLQNDAFDWQITVPANTTATVFIPAWDDSRVTENGQPVENANKVTFLRMENGFAIFAVESGSYTFSSKGQS
jgi:alpha-L-rhamnosidase